MDDDDFEEFYLQRLKTDVNTWRILKKDEKKSQGILLTYVDDLMVVTTEEIGEAFMKRIDVSSSTKGLCKSRFGKGDRNMASQQSNLWIEGSSIVMGKGA